MDISYLSRASTSFCLKAPASSDSSSIFYWSPQNRRLYRFI